MIVNNCVVNFSLCLVVLEFLSLLPEGFFTQISIEISFFWTSERLRISSSLLLSKFGWSPTSKRKSKDFLVCLFPSLPCSLIHLILALLIEIYLKILSSSGLLLNFLIATIASTICCSIRSILIWFFSCLDIHVHLLLLLYAN